MGRHRLRLRPVAVCAARASQHHVGKAEVARRRRKNRNPGALGTPLGGVRPAEFARRSPMRTDTDKVGTSNRRGFLLNGATLAGAVLAPAFAAPESGIPFHGPTGTGGRDCGRAPASAPTVKSVGRAGGKRQQLRLRRQGGPVDLSQRARGL